MRIEIYASRRLKRLIRATTLVLALALPAVVLASDVFTDVPNSNPFHDDISAIARAGVTTGCGAGNFCPAASITRQQESAFLHRGLGRVTGDDAYGLSVPAATDTTVASLSILPGLPGGTVAGANGFLKIDGTVSLYSSAANLCDCFARVQIFVDGAQAPGQTFVYLEPNASFQLSTGAITTFVPVTSGTKIVQLVVNEYIGTETLSAYSSLTALYVPFGGTGTDVAGVTSTTVQVTSGKAPGEK